MLFGCRRTRPSLLTFVLLLLGLKVAGQPRWSEEQREKYFAKRKQFRRKMRDAFAVWDDEEEETEAEDR